MAKIQDVTTEFTKDQRHEKGKVVGYKQENGVLTIAARLTSSVKGAGDLTLLKSNGQPVLNQQKAAGSRKICEYEIQGDENQINEIVSELEITPQAAPQNTVINEDALLAFFEKERDLVHAEIENIKDCRTSIFVRTLAILGAAGLAILGLISVKGQASTLLSWLPFAAAIPILLLTTAIATIIHKVRCINERTGYLEAIEELKTGNALKKMKGWILSYSTDRKCSILHKALKSGCHCSFDNTQLKCSDEARTTAYQEINQHVKLLPTMFNSFTSLCTYIYSIAYVMAVGAFLWSIIYSVNLEIEEKHQTGGINCWFFWGAVVSGILVTAAISILTFKKKLASPEKSWTEYLLQWMGSLSPVIILLLLIGLVASLTYDGLATSVAMFAYVIGGFASAVSVLIAYSSLEKVHSLRRGKFSIDCWKHIWRIRFERCPLLNGTSKL